MTQNEQLELLEFKIAAARDNLYDGLPELEEVPQGIERCVRLLNEMLLQLKRWRGSE